MKREVVNGPIARVIRTVGYTLLLIGSSILLLDVLSMLNFDFITNFLISADNFIIENFGTDIFGVKYIFFIFGTILLLVTLSKNIFLIIISLLLMVITTMNVNLTGAIFFNNLKNHLFNVGPSLESLVNLFNNVINKEALVPLILNILTPFMVYVIIALKKPSRASTKLVSSGMLLFTIFVGFYSLPLLSEIPFLQTTTYLTICNSLLSLSFVVISVGSAMGILGIFRK